MERLRPGSSGNVIQKRFAQNPFVQIILRDSSKTFRSAISANAANALLALATSFFFVTIPLLVIPWSLLLLFQAIGIVATVYSGLVYWRFKARPSTGFVAHCSALAALGFFLAATPAILLGGLLFSFSGYQIASVGYWLKQASRNQPIKCGREGTELAMFGDASLVCPKCSRLLKVGVDVPFLWRNLGVAALIIGTVLRILVSVLSSSIISVLIFPAGLLLANGIVFTLAQLSVYGIFRGSVRLPPTDRSLLDQAAPS